ncbi:type VI secretion system baseplate subunit TssG [Herbaspirillum sp. RV1423]|uniref:type VI secretion system baseplate subunit TssG n=1 Tax=Herbaspirillum sp. RV1423 TaxID=1443993 RepID=UPI000550A245|nr:type VI secretion system baseplate subunit TssG [Herbaspirillum sp. RV1423]
MSFFRFCELLELAAPGLSALGSRDSPSYEPVRFCSRRRLGFPNREIDAIELDPDDPVAPPVVRTTFLGLYGVDARMPSYFIDEIAQNRDGAEPLAAFLDLFHHRIVTQFYRVWRKYRYPAGFRSNGQDDVSRYLLSFAGLGIGDAAGTRQHVGTRKLLSMLGLAGQKTRTAEGLTGVLQHAVPDAQIEVREFHPVWIALTDFERMPLGKNCVLGRGFHDRANAIRVVLRPQSRESVLGLMPGQAQHKEVMALLQFYLGYEAQAHLHMEVRPELMPAPVLNSAEVRLGYSSRLPAVSLAGKKDSVVRVQLGIYDGSGTVH